MCFFVGGTRFSEQGFGIGACSERAWLFSFNSGPRPCSLIAGAAHQNSYLLTLSVIAVLLPAAFHNVVQSTGGVNPLTSEQDGHDILSISHGVCRPLRPFGVLSRKLMTIYSGCRYLAF
jgi:Ca2+:H+ antiporter